MIDSAALPAEQRALPGSPFGPEPSSWPEGLAATGDAAVDRLLSLLPDLPEQDLREHPECYERLHRGLLEELDAEVSAQAPSADPAVSDRS